MISPVESEDPSSTTISSRSRSVWFKTDSMPSGSKAARLKVGRTTEMSGDSREAVCSICAEPSNARLTLQRIEERDLEGNPLPNEAEDHSQATHIHASQSGKGQFSGHDNAFHLTSLLMTWRRT